MNEKEEGAEKKYCAVCEEESSGLHTCLECNKIVHTISGERDENDEGSGSRVTCNICLRKKKLKKRENMQAQI